MASSLVVPIVQLEKVRKHSNADKLELCDILGYQLCIPKSKFKSGDVGVYFPADTILPKEWVEKFGVTNFMKGSNKDRVGKIALRGEPSFGLFVPIPTELEKKDGRPLVIGDNVADYFGAKKYEPPVKADCGNAEKYDSNIDPFVSKYTDIENGRIFTDVFTEGEIVVATEKIHGTNCKIGLVKVNDEFIEIAGSMELRRKIPVKIVPPKNLWQKIKRIFKGDVIVPADYGDKEFRRNVYWYPWTMWQVQLLFFYLRNKYNSHVVLLYGEVFGGSIQNLSYGIPSSKGLDFRAFDISIDGKYIDFEDFERLCERFEIPIAPILYQGPYNSSIKQYAEGNSTLPGADNIREGIVIKPLQERVDAKVGRAVVKIIGSQYELNKKDVDDSKDI